MQNPRLILTAGFTGIQNEIGLSSAERESVSLRNLITDNLKERGIEVINDTCPDCIKNPLKWLNSNYSYSDLLVDVHFGESDIMGVSGTETYVENPSDNLRIVSRELNDITADTLQVVQRGITPLKYSDYNKKQVMQDARTNALLWQVCFVSSIEDIKKYKASKMELIKRVSDKLAEFLFKARVSALAV